MKKIMFHLVLMTMFSYGVQAQIVPAQQPDIVVSGSGNPNTGVAIAPHTPPDFDFTVIVHDDGPNTNTHAIHVLDNQLPGPPFQTLGTYPGDDPDVAFGANPDVFYVVASNSGTIEFEEYYLNGGVPSQYTPYGFAPTPIASGIHPNIDMNSMWQGVVVWEDNQGIYATIAPYYPSNPIVFLGDGIQPDVAVHDDTGMYTVTFINPAGELEINSYIFNDLYFGVLSSITSWGPFPPQSNFRNPRIAAPHNRLIPNAPDFTVVVEDAPFILGFIHSQMGPMAGGIHTIRVNDNPSTACAGNNSFPVVTYSFNPQCSNTDMEIVVAWATEHQPCGFTGGTPNGNSVLLSSIDLNGAPNNNSLTPCMYSGARHNEVNMNNGFYSQSRPAITSEYDGEYLVSELNESVVIYDQGAGQLQWKNRGVPNLFNYKLEESNDLLAGTALSFLNDAASKTFTINSSKDLDGVVTIYNTIGQCLVQQKVKDSQFNHDYANLSAGTYIVSYQTGETLESWTINSF